MSAQQAPKYFALLPAAGSGKRISGEIGDRMPKQYRPIAGKPMIVYALETFAASAAIAASYVIIAADDAEFDRLAIPPSIATALRVGGLTRHHSVLNGLNALAADENDWILVHDAARPGLTPELVARLIAAVQGDAVGGILALPLADTLKQATSEGDEGGERIESTLPRAGLWHAQTPQMFRYGLLKRALLAAIEGGTGVTDEASAIERLGHKPLLVPGSARNFKVTLPEDLAMAEILLRATA